MDLTTRPTITPSNTAVPDSQNPNYPQSIPTSNPNPLPAHTTPDQFTYYPQPHYLHYQQPQFLPTDAVPVPASSYHQPNWHYYQDNAPDLLAHQPCVVVPSNWVEQPVTAIPILPSQAVQSYGAGIGTWKRVSKKTKVIQSAYCDICKVECNSNDILEQHKVGKRHLKNMSKMVQSPPSVNVTGNAVIGPAQNPGKTKDDAGKKSSKRAATSQQDLETKRMKVVAGGAAAAAVRVCAACSVVCNSETVFNYHIAGQKHAAAMKKYLASTTGKTNVAWK